MAQILHPKRTLGTILFIAFLDNLSVGILLPLIPLLLTSTSSPISILPAHLTDTQGYILFGYLLASYTIAQFISTPVLGQLSDKYGRKNILMISLAGTTLAYLLFGYGVLTRNLPLLFVSRVLDGITGGNISVAQAVIADITEPKDRAKTYGIFGSALGIGFAVGPAIGSFFSNPSIVPWFTAVTPFWVTAGLTALSVVIIALALPETLKERSVSQGSRLKASFLAITQAFRPFPHRSLFTGIFTWRTGFGFWTTFGAVFLIYRFGLGQAELGTYFLYTGAWLIASQLFLVPFVANKVSEEKILYLSVFFAALTFLIYLIPTNWYYLFFIIPFLAGANALTFANLQAVVSKAATPTTQGQYAGMSNSVQALALSIAPILSGYLAASMTPVIVVLVSCVLMTIAGIIFVTYAKKKVD